MSSLKKLSMATAGAAFVALGTIAPTQAATIKITVPGTSNPWLAGMPDGSTASGDTAPAQSPVQVGLNFTPKSLFTFNDVIGSVSNWEDLSALTPPDGGNIFKHSSGAENGISDVSAPLNSLVGVFLEPDQPSLSWTPSALDFTEPSSRNYLTLSPTTKQVFFIGDGLTSANEVQQVIAPEGATRLYLGTMDGVQWSNNSGAFDVEVTNSSATPVPFEFSPGLGILALGAWGAMVQLRSKVQKWKSSGSAFSNN